MMPKTNSQTNYPDAGKHRPVHEIRLGRVRASIWQNQGSHATWYNVTLSRLYKHGQEWKSTTSFGRDDLLTVVKVADLANTWIHNQSQRPTATQVGKRKKFRIDVPFHCGSTSALSVSVSTSPLVARHPFF
jgi:hypothetical protein